MTHNIQNLVTKLIGNENSWKLQLLNNWKQIIGDLYPHVRLEQVKEDTLILGVYDASWLQELYLLSNVLLKTINRNLSTPRIKKLQFKQVVKTRKKSRPAPQLQKSYTTCHKRELSPREQKALAKVNDPQLHSALKRFLARCNQETK